MVKRKPLDLKGYYRTLKVSPGVEIDEIRLSYAMVRQNASGPHLKRVEEAFETLKDSTRRAAYDMEGLEGTKIFKQPSTLAAAAALLVLIIAVVYGPGLLRGMKTFKQGQTLVETRTGRPFGVVVQYEDSHQFPQGGSAPAYLVRMAGSAELRWLPSYDLQSICDGR
jgi:curved DNA-binding protein CbpA